MKLLFKNLSYTFIGNIVSLIISMILTLIVPKQLTQESYGYYQLYLFYISYAGFFHLGWPDGIFLRYGGAYYDKLDRPIFSGQFWSYIIIEFIISISISISGLCIIDSKEKAVVICLFGVSMLILLPRVMLQFILQATNRIKEYTIAIMTEKIINIGIVLLVLMFGTTAFFPLVIADIIGKSVSLIYVVSKCADIVCSKPCSISLIKKEAYENIMVGIKLMFANIASQLIIGIVRMAIENEWSIATFGEVSLTMQISNLLMIFINSIALVLFPMLRRTSPDKLREIYVTLRTALTVVLLGALILYYPLKYILSFWLPSYTNSLMYMAFLFPMCVFESKNSMLLNTYLKALRKERQMFFVNLTIVGLSCIVTFLTCFVFHDLNMAILSVVILLAFRCILAEILLTKYMSISVYKDLVLEIFMTFIFIFVNWKIKESTGIYMYIASYVLYVLIKRKDIKYVVMNGKSIIQGIGSK